MRLIAAAVASRAAVPGAPGQADGGHRVVLITIAGVRRQETFSNDGVRYIPRLFGDLLPQSLFYPYIWNHGVTSHFNSIASLLTGRWQHLDDWGGEAPREPTLLDELQRQKHVGANETWIVASNKQLTHNICRKAHVILSKQLLIEATERIILGRAGRQSLDRELLLEELQSVANDDFERIGWSVPSTGSVLPEPLRGTLRTALGDFIRAPEAPVTGDELTFFIAREVLRQASPAFLMVNFSDVEVAHNGVYSMHVDGIRRADRLCHSLWKFLQEQPAYKGRTSMIVVPEFGRDPDGASTNGFFNHRTNSEECRLTWMMVLGAAAGAPRVIEQRVEQISLAPTLGTLLGVECSQAEGKILGGFAV